MLRTKSRMVFGSVKKMIVAMPEAMRQSSLARKSLTSPIRWQIEWNSRFAACCEHHDSRLAYKEFRKHMSLRPTKKMYGPRINTSKVWNQLYTRHVDSYACHSQ